MTATTKIPITYFAPAEREPVEIVYRQAASFGATPFAAELLNSVLNCVFVLNAQRQIVFASQNVLGITPGKTMNDLLGLRPGEALGCVYADDCESGCGTSEFCRQCGAARAILASLAGQRDLQECHLTRVMKCGEESLDLMVLATPFLHNGDHYCLLSVANISHEKRRQALERIFFHDVINLAGGADGLLRNLTTEAPSNIRGDVELSHTAVHDLLEEVEAQRDLAAAERDELSVAPASVRTDEVLRQVTGIYEKHPTAAGKHLRITPETATTEITTDPTLLKRVLGNLVKNALEACATGQTVTASCERADKQVRFSIHNPVAMPRAVQLQIFQRSFTTKGCGRGLGTYSVKLLTERYLQGHASFTSSPEQGTTFVVTLPVKLDGSGSTS